MLAKQLFFGANAYLRGKHFFNKNILFRKGFFVHFQIFFGRGLFTFMTAIVFHFTVLKYKQLFRLNQHELFH